MADWKVVDAEQLDADLTEIADEVRTLVDTLDTMTMEQMTENIAQANEDIAAQTELLAQIKAALENKTASSGGGDPYEIVVQYLNGELEEFYTEKEIKEKESEGKRFIIFFSGQKNLTKWAAPNNNAEFKDSFFCDCPYLSYIDFGNAKTYNPGCLSKLGYITGPAGEMVEELSLVFRAEEKVTIPAFFSQDIGADINIYVPRNLIWDYKQDEYWSSLSGDVRAIEDYEGEGKLGIPGGFGPTGKPDWAKG